MTNSTGSQQANRQRDIDAYLEAFVSDREPPIAEPIAKPKERFVNSPYQSQPAPALDDFQANEDYIQEPQLPSAPARFRTSQEELQKLRQFIEEAQNRNQPRRAAAAPARRSSPRSAGILKLLLFTALISGVTLMAYRYIRNCQATGQCQWNLALPLTVPDRQSPVVSQTAVGDRTPLANPNSLASQSQVAIQPFQVQTPPSPSSNLFRDAVNTATQAVEMAKTAKTEEAWNGIADRWLEAIRLMNAVPRSHARYELAQQKAREYTERLTYVQQEAEKAAQLEQTSLADAAGVQTCTSTKPEPARTKQSQQ